MVTGIAKQSRESDLKADTMHTRVTNTRVKSITYESKFWLWSLIRSDFFKNWIGYSLTGDLKHRWNLSSTLAD